MGYRIVFRKIVRQRLLSQIVRALMAGYIIEIGPDRFAFALRDRGEIIDDGESRPYEATEAGLYMGANVYTYLYHKQTTFGHVWSVVTDSAAWARLVIQPIVNSLSVDDAERLEAKILLATVNSKDAIVHVGFKTYTRLPDDMVNGKIIR